MSDTVMRNISKLKLCDERANSTAFTPIMARTYLGQKQEQYTICRRYLKYFILYQTWRPLFLHPSFLQSAARVRMLEAPDR